MTEHILGINAYHAGASAAVIADGRLVAAAEEERFTRQKYWAGFPVRAIRWCLSEAGIEPQDLDHIGISRNPSANLHRKLLFASLRQRNARFIRDRLANMARVRNLRDVFSKSLGVEPESLKAGFHYVEHHRAHLASAFFVSPFQEAAVVSVDGMGDFVSTMWGLGRGTELEVRRTVNFPHSLGIFYTAATQHLGFPKYGDEGKVMGLAGYGKPAYLDEFMGILRLRPGGGFELDLDYFVHHAEGVDMTWEEGSPTLGTLFSPRYVERFGPPREPGSEITERHADLAASFQAALEEAEFHILAEVHRRTGQRNLCLAGGVALNSSFNGKILPNTPFEEIYIQPAAGDAGTALGVAYYIRHQLLGRPRDFVMIHAYTGPRFLNGRIETALQANGLSFVALEDGALAHRTAQLVAQGQVVGWYQGAMEWGPRALGNRSIIADPRRDDMKDILNARIKHREKFRPFAPSVLLEAVGDYFDQSYPDPFMIKVYNVLPERRSEIPAVTHVDGTGRLQTVDRDSNPLYWELIHAFGEETGIPVVLNTSFNENEPIVCTPEEAIDCFARTKMDALVIGNYLVQKGT